MDALVRAVPERAGDRYMTQSHRAYFPLALVGSNAVAVLYFRGACLAGLLRAAALGALGVRLRRQGGSSGQLKSESVLIKSEAGGALAQAQLLDRPSQIMLHVRHNIDRMPDAAADKRARFDSAEQHMPDMDCSTFVKELKLLARHEFPPVIMPTTESQEGKKKEGRAAGAKARLVKPCQPAVLPGAIAKLVLP
jgi:PleD family two-component response regulator